MTSRLFGVGIAGTELAARERAILERDPPRAVILFRRNIERIEQLRRLVGQIRALPGSPWLCVDQEGGSVDRFRDLLAPSVSFREASRAGLARRAGELAGEACASLDFDIDLAPVVDRLLPGASQRVLGDRCASADPDEVARVALEFLEGLHAYGVGGCVKHFPGLGRADLDTHKELPRIPDDRGEEKRDLAPFEDTMEKAGAVMISHASGSDGVPASLSREKAQVLLREQLGFSGAAFSDDLEMGALAAFGELPWLCGAAANAGCDLLLVCSRIEEFPRCVDELARQVPLQRRGQASARLDTYGRRIGKIRGEATRARGSLEDLVQRIRLLREDVSTRDSG